MKIPLLLALSLLAAVPRPAAAQAPPRPGPTQDWSSVEQRIAWFGTWEGAKRAAKLSARPILLVSAAPHCGGVPGVW